jgi:dipeptidase E
MNQVRLLLASGGFRTEVRIRLLVGEMQTFFAGARRILFIPYALGDHEAYLGSVIEKGLHAGFVLDGIHRHADPRQAIADADAVFVGGGNTFRLLDTMRRLKLLDTLRQRVQHGTPYLGISAGTNLACPTIQTTNDMPIVWPESLESLGLVPFQVNTHYFTGRVHIKENDGYHEHFGETREERIREFHELNDRPVLGLGEGGLLRVEGGHVRLVGAPARLFRKGQEPVDLAPGSLLDFALVSSLR